MAKARLDYEARFRQALKRISIYSSPEWFERHSERQYGLSPEEGIRMAYENVIGEARAALRGYRPKKRSALPLSVGAVDPGVGTSTE